MDRLNKYLQGYPEFLQAPIYAIAIVIIGYFVAKIIALVLASIMGVLALNDDETPTRGMYFTRLLFWSIWLGFCVMGLVKFPVIKEVFYNFYPQEGHFVNYFAVLLGAGILSPLSAPLSKAIFSKLKPIADSFALNNALVRKALGWALFLGTLLAAGISLDAPDSIQEKVIASFLLLGIGGIMGLFVKEVVLNLLSIFDFVYGINEMDLSISVNGIRVKKLSTQKHVYFGYLAFSIFLWAVIKMWGGF